MKRFELKAQKREEMGSAANRRLRREGLVPCVIYTKNDGAVNIKAESNTLDKLIYTPETHLVDIDVEGKKYTAVIREQQFHQIHDYTLHIDFVEVDEKRPVMVELPIKLKGTSPGMLEGGKLVQKLRRMKVKGIYNKLPEFIMVDISHLKLGRSMKVGEVKLSGFEANMPLNIPVATIEIPRALRQTYAKDNPGAGAPA